jgi:signal peptidase I
LKTSLLIYAAQIGVGIGFRLLKLETELSFLTFGVIEVVVTVSVACLIIKSLYQLPLPKAVLAWLPTLVPQFGMILLLLLVIRPFVFEAFSMPTNPMAPTLVGKHLQGVCPQCGAKMFGASMQKEYISPTETMICENFHTTDLPVTGLPSGPQDRFMVAKFLRPQRWDLAVFRVPHNPGTQYCKRVVGLPGESVFIEDGAVWIDGKKLQPPESLKGLQYVTEVEDWMPEMWGTRDAPAILGEDDYFVLGDFSENSNDSRFWQEGATGHPPYAVPADHMRGVASHIYWPPSRWRELRPE